MFPVSYPTSILRFISEIQIPQPFPQEILMEQGAQGGRVLSSVTKVNSSPTLTALERSRFRLALGINRTQTIIFFLIGIELLQRILNKWIVAHRGQL